MQCNVCATHVAELYKEQHPAVEIGWAGPISVCPLCGHVEGWLGMMTLISGDKGTTITRHGGPPAWDVEEWGRILNDEKDDEPEVFSVRFNPNRLPP